LAHKPRAWQFPWTLSLQYRNINDIQQQQRLCSLRQLDVLSPLPPKISVTIKRPIPVTKTHTSVHESSPGWSWACNCYRTRLPKAKLAQIVFIPHLTDSTPDLSVASGDLLVAKLVLPIELP
jgi:hypothetical protein